MITNTQASNYAEYFPLYQPTGETFQVLAGSESYNRTTQLEFLFKPIGGNTPQVTVYTNQTAETLRYLYGNSTMITAVPECFPHGESLGDVKTQSAIGSSKYRFDWIANLTIVYNNTRVNAESAAQELYNHDDALIPPPPSYLVAFLQAFWVYIIVGVGAVLTSLQVSTTS